MVETYVELGIMTLGFNLLLIQFANGTRLDPLRFRQLASPRFDPSTQLDQILKISLEVTDDLISVLQVPRCTLSVA